jgi:hypothetical protein
MYPARRSSRGLARVRRPPRAARHRGSPSTSALAVRPKLLIIDELGYLPFRTAQRDLFFQLVARRHEPGSLLITTNQVVTQWGTVFDDGVLDAAILDRLLHHSHTLMIHGESLRLKQKRKAAHRRFRADERATRERTLQEHATPWHCTRTTSGSSPNGSPRRAAEISRTASGRVSRQCTKRSRGSLTRSSLRCATGHAMLQRRAGASRAFAPPHGTPERHRGGPRSRRHGWERHGSPTRPVAGRAASARARAERHGHVAQHRLTWKADPKAPAMNVYGLWWPRVWAPHREA